jgi:Uma2 family endonuclease
MGRTATPVVYPDSDGQPMADNTLQFEWITALKQGFEAYFRDRPDVFVAGDLLWYPVEGDNRVRQAPDVLIAFGRPKGYRGSYRQWEEGGVAPQAVVEVRSPGNRAGEMARKLVFYDTHGAEEYYDFDPDRNRLTVYARTDGGLDEVPVNGRYVSPLLGVTFDVTGPELVVRTPDGGRFLTYQEQSERADAERARADSEKQRADAETQRAERMAARLRELGIDPDTV